MSHLHTAHNRLTTKQKNKRFIQNEAKNDWRRF